MVIENLEDVKLEEYSYSKNLQTAFKYLKSHDLLALPAGKTVVDGDNVYINRSSYVAKNFEDAKIEGHNNYLDIQLVVKGEEAIGYVDIRKPGLVATPYNVEKDRTNYTGKVDGIINLRANFFALVFPNDLHQPCIKVNDELVEKVVCKVKIDF